MPDHSLTRERKKPLGVVELIAVALGGMVGGGIFTILGISVSIIGSYTPFAVIIGGMIAALAAYSYIKLGVYYKDEGATYSFYKRTFPKSNFRASLIGWWVIFGYISTLALYAYTFASYALSSTEFANADWMRKILASIVILFFTLINVWSVKGMGKIEDILVYTKLLILTIISFTLINNSQTSFPTLLAKESDISFMSILIVSSLTFVAYEGFQLVINAVNEMTDPEKNIPRAIYSAIFLAILIYSVISIGAIMAIPFKDIIQNKEFALAAGAQNILGNLGRELVILGAILATSSAISGTIFGASRQMSVIAHDGYFPSLLAKRKNNIPIYSILAMAFCAIALIAMGSLEMILEFGSVTFLLVSLLMAFANHKIRKQTNSNIFFTISAIIGLSFGTIFIIYFEAMNQLSQLIFICGLYVILTLGSWLYSRKIKIYIPTSSTK